MRLLDGFDWVFVSMLRRTDDAVPENVTGRVTVVLPTGEIQPGPAIAIDLAAGLTSRNITKIPQLPYTIAGVYTFQLQVEVHAQWETLGEYKVNVAA